MWVITISYVDGEIQTERQPAPARAVLDTGKQTRVNLIFKERGPLVVPMPANYTGA